MIKFTVLFDEDEQADHFQETLEEMTTVQFGEDEPDIKAKWSRDAATEDITTDLDKGDADD